jgi:hypothetical protein
MKKAHGFVEFHEEVRPSGARPTDQVLPWFETVAIRQKGTTLDPDRSNPGVFLTNPSRLWHFGATTACQGRYEMPETVTRTAGAARATAGGRAANPYGFVGSSPITV